MAQDAMPFAAFQITHSEPYYSYCGYAIWTVFLTFTVQTLVFH